MTYRFKLQEPVGEGVRRIGLEQIGIAEAKLASKGDATTAIHDARRCLKRLRALLRLIRPGIEEAIYRREVEHLAATGRLLSRARDLAVMHQTLDQLEGRFGPLPNGATERLCRLLADGRGSSRRSDAAGRRQAVQRMSHARTLFESKATAAVRLGHLVDGLGRVYRKARKAFRHAYLEPSDDTFHAWRKQVQLHWRHMLLLSRGWPEVLSARAGEAKELSQLLGEDHDYSILVTHAGKADAAFLRPGDISSLSALCRARQAEIRSQAHPRGERLFAEPARNLEHRVALYWTSAQELATLTPGKEKKLPKETSARRPRRARHRKP